MRSNRGFSLIELMIGMAIGLLCTVVIASVLSMAEGRRRGSTSGTDAQIAGSLAIYQLTRDIASAGYGFTSEPLAVGCNLTATRGGAVVTDAADTNKLPQRMAPVMITEGLNGASDVVRTLASSKGIELTASNATASSLAIPARVPTMAAGDQTLSVPAVIGYRQGDLVLAVDFPAALPPADVNCFLLQVSGAPVPPALPGSGAVMGNATLPIATNAAGWNAPNQPPGLNNLSFLVNLGRISDRLISVNANQALVLSDLDTATMTRTERVAQSGVVLLKAMYGMDTNADGAVDTYTYAQPATWAAWSNMLAVRVAVVARSAHFEREEVTTEQPKWRFGGGETVDGSSACGDEQCLDLRIDNLPDWKHYRYKVYDTLVSVRNQRWRTESPVAVPPAAP